LNFVKVEPAVHASPEENYIAQMCLTCEKFHIVSFPHGAALKSLLRINEDICIFRSLMCIDGFADLAFCVLFLSSVKKPCNIKAFYGAIHP
jgi:hypothetical protein